MRPILEFAKTTLIGGVIIILPVYLCVLLLAKANSSLMNLMKPIAAGLPDSLAHAEILSIVILAALCFSAGLIVRTAPGLRVKKMFERAVLEKLPGYQLLRGLTGRLTGQADDAAFAPALVEIEDALVPALIIEELEDGSYTVLVPSVPTPMAGSLYILPRGRVHPVDVPFTSALKVFSKWGAGAGAFVAAMQPPAVADASRSTEISVPRPAI